MPTTHVPFRLVMRAPGHPWFRMVAPGLVELTMPRATDDEAVVVAFAELERWMFADVDAPYGFVIRLDEVFALTSRQRRLIAEAEARYASVERRYNAGQAIVLKSPVQRGIFTAFTWIAPPVWPYRIFGDEAAAVSWLAAHVAEVGAEFPDGLRWRGRLRDADSSSVVQP